MNNSKARLKVRMLCESAVMVVLAQILGYVKLWEMPWGGSVCLVMLPIFVVACRWGAGVGIMSGFVLGVLQFVFDGGFALGWQSIIGDYLLAFAVLGVAGVVCRKPGGLVVGTIFGSAGRFLVHYVVGATIWAEYMPEAFFGLTMTSPWIYSLLYNLAYMLPNMLITLLVAVLLEKKLRKFLLGQDLV